MTGRSVFSRCAWGAATLATGLFAAWIAVDTVRLVLSLWSPLPWFDAWASADLLRAWQAGRRTLGDVLFAQHNEHRILVPRLFFIADAVLARGGGGLCLAAIFLVQALHAGVFGAVLSRARPARAGRWAVAAAVLALMFGLRQAENFTSPFQLQFVAVFAGATLSMALFGLAVARLRAGRGAAAPLALCLGAALVDGFTMANGLAVGPVLVALALLARLPGRVVLLLSAFSGALAAVYLHGYQPVARHGGPADVLYHPLGFATYAAAYLGSIAAQGDVGAAAAFGGLGVFAFAVATVRAARRHGGSPESLALLGVMGFVVAAALVTAAGRLKFGVDQALSSRYSTGSAAFWSAQLVYWWVDPPAVPRGPALARAAVAVLAAALCLALAVEQGGAVGAVAAQSFAQNEAADLLMLGLDDDDVVLHIAWNAPLVRQVLPTLKADGLSIFGTAEGRGIGAPVAERGAVEPAGGCGGSVAARSDPALGPGGVRVAGTAWGGAGRRTVRRVYLADADGRLVGLGSGLVPGADRAAWRGFALGAPGAALTAYALLPGRRLCPVGAAVVAPAPGQTSQPVEAP